MVDLPELTFAQELRDNNCDLLISVSEWVCEWLLRRRQAVEELPEADMGVFEKEEAGRNLLNEARRELDFWGWEISNHNCYPYDPELHWLGRWINEWEGWVNDYFGDHIEYPLTMFLEQMREMREMKKGM